MDKNAQLATLNNAVNALDELDIKGSSSDMHSQIKSAIRAVMQAIITEAQAEQAAAQGGVAAPVTSEEATD